MQPIKRIIKQNTGLHFLVDITCLNRQKEHVTLYSVSSRQKSFYKNGAGFAHLGGWIHHFQAVLSDLPSACQEKHLLEWWLIVCSLCYSMFLVWCFALICWGAVCYLFIYLWGGCLWICLQLGLFVVKPRLTLLIISGGCQGFCSQWAGECQGSPIV